MLIKYSIIFLRSVLTPSIILSSCSSFILCSSVSFLRSSSVIAHVCAASGKSLKANNSFVKYCKTENTLSFNPFVNKPFPHLGLIKQPFLPNNSYCTHSRNMSSSVALTPTLSSTTATATITENENTSHVVLKPQKLTKEKFRLDYKPPNFIIEHIDVKLELSDKNTKVSSKLLMRRNNLSLNSLEAKDLPDLKLDGEGLKLLKVEIDGKEIAHGLPNSFTLGDSTDNTNSTPKGYVIDQDGDNITINKKFLPENSSDKFTVYTEVYISPIENLKFMGLYKTGSFFCTQCEAEGFRRITYFLDRPDVMATYNVRIECDKSKSPVMLSNGNLVEKGDIKDSENEKAIRHFAVFSDPHPKPSYLFALVAGDLKSIKDTFQTKSGRKVQIEIFAQDDVNKLKWAMESIKKAMKWDEDTFNLEYDLDNFYIVCTRDFNMGAMENKGLNIFNAALLLADDKSTDGEYQRILGVIGHEYFHNWTGNRVTCRDWFQLTLKEGLTVYRDQRFTSDMYSHAAKRIEDVKFMRSIQFKEDSGPMSHPIRPESYIAMDNFYTATVYDKGAEVIRMYATILGDEGFKKGMELYFKRHDGQAVTCDDFRSAMADANNYDLAQFERWYLQAGTPEVQVLESEYLKDKKVYRITFLQKTPPTPKQSIKLPLHIPIRIGLIGKESKKDLIDYNTVFHLKKETQTFEIPNIEEDCIPSILRDFSAPVKLKNKFETDEDLAFLMAYDSDEFNKWDAGEKLKLKIILGREEMFKKIFQEKYAEKRKTKLNKEDIDNDFDIYDNLDNYFRKYLSNAEGTDEYKEISDLFINSIRTALLDESQDNELKSYALSLPSVDTIANEIKEYDPIIIKQCIDSIRKEIYRKLKNDLLNTYNALTMSDDYIETLEKKDTARRALRNVLLSYLTCMNDAESIELAYKHYKKSKNMTDKLAAFRCLTSIKSDKREDAIKDFFDFANADPLTIDKWVAIQALSDSHEFFDDIVKLKDHPEFTYINPNRFRSLYMTFSRNVMNFHRKDGEGYKFLADSVIYLDKLNPQVAARACSLLIHGNKMSEPFKTQMRKELERIYQTPGLSNDTYEICARTLAVQ